MFSCIRRRFTYANVAMTLALVFAMSGGAYAAKHYLITSTKQISPKVLKALQGKAGAAGSNGAQGPAGAAGPQGPAGKDGANGTNGKDGVPGSSVASAESKAKLGPCKEGGSEFKAGASTTFACNGEKGKEGTFGGQSLPSGKSLTGAFAASAFSPVKAGEPEFARASTGVSFAIPVPGLSLSVRFVGPGEGENEEESKWAPAIKSGECKGFSQKPVAAAGKLCIFTESEENVFSGKPTAIPYGSAESTLGFIVFALPAAKGPISVTGTWAVTAE